jgi:hypothetical protein
MRAGRLTIALTLAAIHADFAIALAAQEVSQADLARCAGLDEAAEKLACFEALAESPQSREAEPTTAEEPLAPAAAPAPVLPEPADTAPAATQEAAAEPPPVATAAPVAAAPPADPARPPDAAEVPVAMPDDLGAEYLEERQSDGEESPSTITATVTSVSVEGRLDTLYFHFANGQVWRQLEPRRFRYPKNEAFDVIISRGMMGDYRLRIDEDSPMTRIQRVE